MTRPPKLFISGHSHILKVKYDKTLDMLHINPGAAGMSGFHKVRTLVRFVIERGRLRTWKLSSWQINNFSYYFCHLGFLSDLCTQFMNNEDEHEGNYSCRWQCHSPLSAF